MNNLIISNFKKPLSNNNLMNVDVFDMFEALFKNKYAIQNMETLPIEVIHNNQSYNISVEAPGVKKEDIDIHLEKGYLNISVESKDIKEKKDGENIIMSERYYSKKTRSVYLGNNIDENSVKASYEDGVLKIEVPKTQNQLEHKKIEIQ